MRYTNELGLPQPLVSAVENDDYLPSENVDITVTQLIDSPQVVKLRRDHESDLVEDVADNIWRLMGQAVHQVLERASSTGLTEERYSVGIPWFGQTILLEGGFDRVALVEGSARAIMLQDYKFASVWEWIFGIKPDKVAQLNVLRYILSANEIEVDQLQLVFIFRDWSIGQYEKRPSEYPPRQVEVLDVDVWTNHETERYIDHQLNRHFGETTPECTPDEMWAQDEKWAVMKEGRRSALRVLDTCEEANEWLTRNLKPGERAKVVHRPGVPNRCRLRGNGRAYCPVQAQCPQWAEMQQVNGWDAYGRPAR